MRVPHSGHGTLKQGMSRCRGRVRPHFGQMHFPWGTGGGPPALPQGHLSLPEGPEPAGFSIVSSGCFLSFIPASNGRSGMEGRSPFPELDPNAAVLEHMEPVVPHEAVGGPPPEPAPPIPEDGVRPEPKKRGERSFPSIPFRRGRRSGTEGGFPAAYQGPARLRSQGVVGGFEHEEDLPVLEDADPGRERRALHQVECFLPDLLDVEGKKVGGRIFFQGAGEGEDLQHGALAEIHVVVASPDEGETELRGTKTGRILYRAPPEPSFPGGGGGLPFLLPDVRDHPGRSGSRYLPEELLEFLRGEERLFLLMSAGGERRRDREAQQDEEEKAFSR